MPVLPVPSKNLGAPSAKLPCWTTSVFTKDEKSRIGQSMPPWIPKGQGSMYLIILTEKNNASQ